MARTARIRVRPLEGFRTHGRDLGKQKIEKFSKKIIFP